MIAADRGSLVPLVVCYFPIESPLARQQGEQAYLEIEKVSGQVIYAITSFNSFVAVRADTHTIPWSKLKYDPQLHGYRTDITKDQVHNAPEFSRGDEFDWPEQERERLHRYWHSPPYGGM